ncbi:MAG: hypothetical protein PQJ50_18520 [Spirochaetales bacterium]|nr:hypothetical protein [Spirochaetales bacterium]
MNLSTLKIQILFSRIAVVSAVILSIFSLGFMTDFYHLFMDGNSDMYSYFKDLQILNNAVFQASVIFLVLSFFLKGFDINKKAAGKYGVIFTLILAVINIFNSVSIFGLNGYFIGEYRLFDFSDLGGYEPSVLPYVLIYVLFSLAAAVSVTLFALTGYNFISKRKQEADK